METSKSSGAAARRHGRNISHPTPTRTAAGPLDAAEEAESGKASPESASPATSTAAAVAVAAATAQPPASPPKAPEAAAPQRPSSTPILTLRFLQDSKIYHVLGSEDVPDAFLNSEQQPPTDATLPDLLARGHFRRAAETARRGILQSAPDAVARIFTLLYTRLACLVLLSRPDVAAQEAAPLADLLARNPAGTAELVPRIPWDLRVLLVRLQAIGLADGGRRAVMSLYALAGEARENLRQTQSSSSSGGREEAGSAASEEGEEEETWARRLEDLGLRVCDTLVEMGELETAARHLTTLAGVDAEELAYRQALLRLRVGDVDGARRRVVALTEPARRKGLEALIQTAVDHDVDALAQWQALIEEFPGHELFAQNAAVSLLYTGHITSARELLEEMVQQVPMFPALLFNLSTVYELCTESAPERKAALVRAAAAKPPAPASGGWERANFEFKL